MCFDLFGRRLAKGRPCRKVVGALRGQDLNLRPSGYEVATDTSKLFAQADHEAVRQYPKDEWIVPRVCKIAGRHP
jgi:hypothetical protein